jgi:hypothetical protein
MLLFGASGLSGCVTTEHDRENAAAEQEAQSKAWDDLTPLEKVGDFALLILAYAAYGLAGGTPK